MVTHQRKSATGSVFLLLAFLLLFIPFAAAEDSETLRWRIKDVSTRYLRVQRALAEKETILVQLDEQSTKLREAYLQIQGLNDEVKGHLQSNLSKSTILLANDTFTVISLPFLALEESVVLISAQLLKEVILNELQEELSGTYQTNLEQISREAAAMAPELAAVRRLMNLSLEQIRAEAADGEQLGDVGLVYRKFWVVIEALEAAVPAVPRMRAKIEDLKNKHTSEIEVLQSRRDSLQVELAGLEGRLVAALSDERVAREEADTNQIGNAVVPADPIDPPTVSAQQPDETNLEQYLKHYQAALPMLETDYPWVLETLSSCWTDLETDLAALRQDLADFEILQGDSVHSTTQALLEIEEWNLHTLRLSGQPISGSQDLYDAMEEAKPKVQAAKLRVAALLAECRDFLPKIAELGSLLGEREELQVFMSSVLDRWTEIMPSGQAIPPEYNVFVYAASLTPVPGDFSPDIEAREEEVIALAATLWELERDLAVLLEVIEENKKTALEFFNTHGREERKKFARMEEAVGEADELLAEIIEIFHEDRALFHEHPFGQAGPSIVLWVAGETGDYQLYPYPALGGPQSENEVISQVLPHIRNGDPFSVMDQRDLWFDLVRSRSNTSWKYMVTRTQLLDLWAELRLLLIHFSNDATRIDLSLASSKQNTALPLPPPVESTYAPSRLDDLSLNVAVITEWSGFPTLSFTAGFDMAIELAQLMDEVDFAALNWRWLEEAEFLESKEDYERQLDGLIARYPEVAQRWAGGANAIRAAIDEGVRQHGVINGLQTYVPVIVAQPMDQTVLEGSRATLTVEAEGPALRYLWEKVAGAVHPGGSGATFVTDPLEEDVSFQVTITSSNGSVTSREVGVTVVPADQGLLTASLDQEAYPGGGTTGWLTVETSNPGLSWSITDRPSWVTVTEGTRLGNAVMSLEVLPNPTGFARTGTLSLGAMTLLIRQEAPASDYAAWADRWMDSAAPGGGIDDDYNGDGVSNLLAFFHDFDPRKTGGANQLPHMIRTTDDFGRCVIQFRFRQNKEAVSLPLQVSHSSDLGSWEKARLPVRTLADEGEAWLLGLDVGIDELRSAGFWRVEVSAPSH